MCVKRMSVSDIAPVLFEVKRFRSTNRTPNSERYKNQNCYRFMAIVDGKATFETAGTKSIIEKNDCIYLVPGECYRILNTYGDFEVLNVWFGYKNSEKRPESFNTVYDDDYDDSKSVDTYEFYEASELAKSMHIKTNRHMCSLIKDINLAYNSCEICREIKIEAALLNIVSELITTSKTENRDTKPVGEILIYIQQHITEKITAEELALKFHYHKNHINRIIKQATGMTLRKYIINEKITYAKQLMRETNLSMTEIASALSFYDYSHFCKYFKENQSR